MIRDLFDAVKLQKKLNTVTNERDMLENAIKDELYKSFMAKLEEPLAYERYKKENKRLREQIKTLKDIIKNGDVNNEK
jgi:cell division protein FtsB